MSKTYHFLRLIRFLNLVVIILTMLMVQYFVTRHLYFPNDNLNASQFPFVQVDILKFSFILLVVSTVLIAAAGNIINDYFDVKADRINKPERTIINVHIKRRWAMFWHWTFNLIGFILSLYIGYLLHNIWIPISAFFSINLLWFYSVYYKRKPFTGNLIVAILLAGVPFYVLILNYYRIDTIYDFNSNISFPKYYFIVVIFCIAFLALFMNLIRELIKDIIDIRGDLRLEAKTFPIKFGIKKTKYLIGLIAVFLLGSIVFYYSFVSNYHYSDSSLLSDKSGFSFFILSLGATVFLMVLSLFFTFRNNKIKSYRLSSNLIKLAILFGLLTILFI